MRSARITTLLAFGAAAVGLTAAGSRGQTPADVVAVLKPYVKTVELAPQTSGKVRAMMTAQIRILKTPDEKLNLEALDEFARHFAAKVTQEKYYDQGSESGELKARPAEASLDVVFADLRGYLLRPSADNVAKMTVDNADYVKEFGAALDRAIVPLLKANAPLVRVNAARMYAVAAESGAPAHAKTIIGLLNDPKTPPEVLLYAYQAAQGYLAAYDPYAVGRPDPNRHAGDPADVIALIQALDRHVIFPKDAPNGPVADRVIAAASAAPAPPADAAGAAPADGGTTPRAARLESTGLTPQQVQVIRYFRKHAVRALAQVRFDILGGKSNLPEVRPAFTLARVAVSDPAVSPPSSAAEAADAVAGLCGMNVSPQANVDVLVDAMAAGVVTFGLVKNLNPADRSLPWKVYAARLSAAFADFKASVNRNPKAFASKSLIFSLADVVNAAVLSRLEKPDSDGRAGPDVERVRAWIQQNPPKDAARQLFNDNPAYRLNPRPQ